MDVGRKITGEMVWYAGEREEAEGVRDSTLFSQYAYTAMVSRFMNPFFSSAVKKNAGLLMGPGLLMRVVNTLKYH